MRYAVNPDELRELAVGLGAVADALGRLGARDQPDATAVGSPAVAQALRQVSDNWRRSRRRLHADLGQLAGAVDAAAATYAAVDRTPFGGPAGVGR